MLNFFNNRSRIEILKEKYTAMMRKSFRLALKDKEASEKLQRKAQELYNEIQYLSLQQADK